jgi:hypothetical protein
MESQVPTLKPPRATSRRRRQNAGVPRPVLQTAIALASAVMFIITQSNPMVQQPFSAATTWKRIELVDPSGAQRVAVASAFSNAAASTSAAVTWIAGSYLEPARTGEFQVHRPALWRCALPNDCTAVPVAPRTPYGEVHDLYSVAAGPDGVVALGVATGGAHGNPRTQSWYLDETGTLREAAASFELFNGVRQIGVRTISRGPAGWVIFGSRINQNELLGAASWRPTTSGNQTFADGSDFTLNDRDPALSSESNREQVQGLDVSEIGDVLVGVGERFSANNGSIDYDGIVWSSPNGDNWSRITPPGASIGGARDQRIQHVASNNDWVVFAGTETTNFVSTRFVVWSNKRALPVTANKDRLFAGTFSRSFISPFGKSNDVLSNISALTFLNGTLFVGGRIGSQLKLAKSVDGRNFENVVLPKHGATDNRSRLTLGVSPLNTLLVGVVTNTPQLFELVRT